MFWLHVVCELTWWQNRNKRVLPGCNFRRDFCGFIEKCALHHGTSYPKFRIGWERQFRAVVPHSIGTFFNSEIRLPEPDSLTHFLDMKALQSWAGRYLNSLEKGWLMVKDFPQCWGATFSSTSAEKVQMKADKCWQEGKLTLALSSYTAI